MLSEKIYMLRKKSGLSQEQLAEKLGVSRQAISKWETGTSLPEIDKLILLSECFNVSIDNLVKEQSETEQNNDDGDYNHSTKQNDECEDDGVLDNTKPNNSCKIDNKQMTDSLSKSKIQLLGLIICVIGIVCMVLWGVISLFMPSNAERIDTSSMIQLNGNGIFLMFCTLLTVVGALIYLNGSKK